MKLPKRVFGAEPFCRLERFKLEVRPQGLKQFVQDYDRQTALACACRTKSVALLSWISSCHAGLGCGLSLCRKESTIQVVGIGPLLQDQLAEFPSWRKNLRPSSSQPHLLAVRGNKDSKDCSARIDEPLDKVRVAHSLTRLGFRYALKAGHRHQVSYKGLALSLLMVALR